MVSRIEHGPFPMSIAFPYLFRVFSMLAPSSAASRAPSLAQLEVKSRWINDRDSGPRAKNSKNSIA